LFPFLGFTLLLDKLADLGDHPLDVVTDASVGEPQDGIAVQLELDVTAAVGVKFDGLTMFRPVYLDHAPFLRPDEIQPDRVPQNVRLIRMVPTTPNRPCLRSQLYLQSRFDDASRMRRTYNRRSQRRHRDLR